MISRSGASASVCSAILRCDPVENVLFVTNVVEADHREAIANQISRNTNYCERSVYSTTIMPFWSHQFETVLENNCTLASNTTKVVGFNVGAYSTARQITKKVLKRWRQKHEFVTGVSWSCLWCDLRVDQIVIHRKDAEVALVSQHCQFRPPSEYRFSKRFRSNDSVDAVRHGRDQILVADNAPHHWAGGGFESDPAAGSSACGRSMAGFRFRHKSTIPRIPAATPSMRSVPESSCISRTRTPSICQLKK